MGIQLRFSSISGSSGEMDRQNAEEHQLIYQALLEKDEDKTCELLKEHFEKAIKLQNIQALNDTCQ
jgi:DNA-binding GntR family transcriptional regulator